ncbi:hypothetical protein [Streptomyces sp. NPDC018031]|uniref:hypothetical protein n=1 Tax=Streptomyces sp. NPDC018031 TaxID=3365033 RepID=UPI0037B71B49
MRKLHKAAVVAAMLGSIGFMGAGTAAAGGKDDGPKVNVSQNSSCKSHDLNLNVNVEVLTKILTNTIFGEGDHGTDQDAGARQDCSNHAF